MAAADWGSSSVEVLQEVEWKLARTREFMRARGLDAILLSRADDFAWITCGGNSRCVSTTDVGVASVFVTLDSQFVITPNVEAERLKQETLAHVEPTGVFEFAVHPWFESPVEAFGQMYGGLGGRHSVGWGRVGVPGYRISQDAVHQVGGYEVRRNWSRGVGRGRESVFSD